MNLDYCTVAWASGRITVDIKRLLESPEGREYLEGMARVPVEGNGDAFLSEVERRAGGPPSLEEIAAVLESVEADAHATKRECMMTLWLRRIIGEPK